MLLKVVFKLETIQFAGPLATGGGELLIKCSITPPETNYFKCLNWKIALYVIQINNNSMHQSSNR